VLVLTAKAHKTFLMTRPGKMGKFRRYRRRQSGEKKIGSNSK